LPTGSTVGTIRVAVAGRGGGGEELNPDYYRAALAPKALWKIAESHHVGGFQARSRAYEKRVTSFFDRALLAESSPRARSALARSGAPGVPHEEHCEQRPPAGWESSWNGLGIGREM
jgi:hypothetical protein